MSRSLMILFCIFCFGMYAADIPPPQMPQPQDIIPTESYEHTFVKMLASLLGLLALIVLTIWMLRRISRGKTGGSGSNKTIKILERRPLSQKSALYLIEVGGKQVLIAESQLEVRALTSFEEPPPETTTP